jgi:predicted anti-sigma-YlaC factor YlaD
MSFNCEETYQRMQDYLDRELSPSEMALVKEHLDGCGICSEEFEFEAKVLRKIG